MNIHQLKRYLPSKKFSIGIGIILVAGILYLIINALVGDGKGLIGFTTKSVNERGDISEDILNLDTDGDGLYDWEEQLWGTNPNQADSDGDGISDFDFVASQRTKIQDAQLPELEGGQSTFNQGILSLYLALLSSGANPEDAQTELSIAFINQTSQLGMPNVYSKISIDIATQNEENLARYRTGLDSAFSKYPVEDGDLVSVVEIQDEATLEKEETKNRFQKLYERYSALEDELLQLTPPAQLANTHVDLLNGVHNLVVNYQALAEQRSEIEVLSAVIFITTNWETFGVAVTEILDYFGTDLIGI